MNQELAGEDDDDCLQRPAVTDDDLVRTPMRRGHRFISARGLAPLPPRLPLNFGQNERKVNERCLIDAARGHGELGGAVADLSRRSFLGASAAGAALLALNACSSSSDSAKSRSTPPTSG